MYAVLSGDILIGLLQSASSLRSCSNCQSLTGSCVCPLFLGTRPYIGWEKSLFDAQEQGSKLQTTTFVVAAILRLQCPLQAHQATIAAFSRITLFIVNCCCTGRNMKWCCSRNDGCNGHFIFCVTLKKKNKKSWSQWPQSALLHLQHPQQ